MGCICANKQSIEVKSNNRTKNKIIMNLTKQKNISSVFPKKAEEKLWGSILSFLTYQEIYACGKTNRKINKVSTLVLKKKKDIDYKNQNNKEENYVIDNSNIKSQKTKKSFASTRRLSILGILEKNYEGGGSKSETITKSLNDERNLNSESPSTNNTPDKKQKTNNM